MKLIRTLTLATLACGIPLAAGAQTTSSPQMPMIAANQVPPSGRQLQREAAMLGREGAITLDNLRLVGVRGWHGRISEQTRTMIATEFGKVEITGGSHTTYSNSPPPGTLADWLGRNGYSTSDVVALQVQHNGPVTVYLSKPAGAM